MSYSVDEAIADAEKRRVDLKAIQVRYPNATLDSLPNGQQEWCDTVDATDAIVLTNAKGEAFFCPYVNVGGLRVYARQMWFPTCWRVLDVMKKDHPIAYAALVAASK